MVFGYNSAISLFSGFKPDAGKCTASDFTDTHGEYPCLIALIIRAIRSIDNYVLCLVVWSVWLGWVRQWKSAWCCTAEAWRHNTSWAMWRICGVSKADPALFVSNIDDDYVRHWVIYIKWFERLLTHTLRVMCLLKHWSRGLGGWTPFCYPECLKFNIRICIALVQFEVSSWSWFTFIPLYVYAVMIYLYLIKILH